MKAIILGATGLVGSKLLSKLIHDSHFTEVISFSRRPLDLTHPNLKQIVSPLKDFDHGQELFHEVDALFCCVGTTIKKAGSQKAFKTVDYDLPLMAAQVFKKHQGKHFLIITAVGSDPESPFFYNKTKGQLEEALKALNLNRLSLIKPSLLLGQRAESRFFEGLGQIIFPALNPFIPDRYKAVSAEDVAETLLQTALCQSFKNNIWVETF